MSFDDLTTPLFSDFNLSQPLLQALDDAGIEPTAIFDSTQPGHVRIAIGAPPAH